MENINLKYQLNSEQKRKILKLNDRQIELLKNLIKERADIYYDKDNKCFVLEYDYCVQYEMFYEGKEYIVTKFSTYEWIEEAIKFIEQY